MDSSLSRNQKKLLIASGFLAMGAGVTYYIKNRSKPKAPTRVFSREEVITVLNRFKRDYYPIFKYIFNMFNRKIATLRRQGLQVRPNQLKTFQEALTFQNPEFLKMVSDLEESVYKRFSIEEKKDFEAQCNEMAKTDLEVRALMQAIRNSLTQASSGRLDNGRVKLPPMITVELVFDARKEIIIMLLNKINNYIDNYKKENGQINERDPKFAMEFALVMKPEKEKSQVLTEKGFDFSEEHHPALIYDLAIEQFRKTNKSFAFTYERMTEQHTIILQKILQQTADHQKLAEEIEKIREKKLADPQNVIEEANNPLARMMEMMQGRNRGSQRGRGGFRGFGQANVPSAKEREEQFMAELLRQRQMRARGSRGAGRGRQANVSGGKRVGQQDIVNAEYAKDVTENNEEPKPEVQVPEKSEEEVENKKEVKIENEESGEKNEIDVKEEEKEKDEEKKEKEEETKTVEEKTVVEEKESKVDNEVVEDVIEKEVSEKKENEAQEVEAIQEEKVKSESFEAIKDDSQEEKVESVPEVKESVPLKEEEKEIKSQDIQKENEAQNVQEPEVIEEPEVIQEPEVIEEPEMTKEPEQTQKTELVVESEVNQEPEVAEEPKVTEVTEVTQEPEVTEEPEVAEVTEKPEVIESPVEQTENVKENTEETKKESESENEEEIIEKEKTVETPTQNVTEPKKLEEDIKEKDSDNELKDSKENTLEESTHQNSD